MDSNAMAEETLNTEKIAQEIIQLERRFYFEKKNVKSSRLSKLKELIERHTPFEAEK